jgi:hypothetical protein
MCLYIGLRPSNSRSPGGKFAQKHVPLNLRHILSAESAANDGLAYPFLTISLYLTLEASRGVAVGKWFIVGWLCAYSNACTFQLHHCCWPDQVILGVLFGAFMGKLSLVRGHFTFTFYRIRLLSSDEIFPAQEVYRPRFFSRPVYCISILDDRGGEFGRDRRSVGSLRSRLVELDNPWSLTTN